MRPSMDMVEDVNPFGAHRTGCYLIPREARRWLDRLSVVSTQLVAPTLKVIAEIFLRRLTRSLTNQ